MFERLMASDPTGRRNLAQAIASVAVHGFIAAVAVHATTAAGPPAAPSRDTILIDLPLPTRSAEPAAGERHGGGTRSSAASLPAHPAPAVPSLPPPSPTPALQPLGEIEPDLAALTKRGGGNDEVRGDSLRVGDTTRPYTAAELDRAVEILHQPVPAYPPVLLSAGITGSVDLEFVVGIDGRVEPATLMVRASTHPAFITGARNAILATRFRPAMWRGRPVRQLVRQRIRFDAIGG